MSFEGKIYQDLTSNEDSLSHRQTFGQGLFAERVGFAFQQPRVVILGLGLLNAALLITAAVIGIYCANAKDLQVTDLEATPLLLEMNFLRNHTNIVKEKVEAQKALVKERADNVQMTLEMKQKRILADSLEKRIGVLRAEKTSLQSNRTALEKNCNRCPTGWSLLKTSCYYFSRYEAPATKNWPDSRADCIRKGGDLLVIDSLVEQQIINSNFPRVESSGFSGWLHGSWIGLTDVKRNGTWVWVNNKTEETTTYWSFGQPSITGPQSGHCVAFLSQGDSMRTWYNRNCHQNRLNWICEMEPSKS